MVSVIPGMLLIGWAVNPVMLYIGLALFSFGKKLLLYQELWVVIVHLGAGTVVPSMTTLASQFGEIVIIKFMTIL